MTAAGVAEFTECFGFDLADAFAGDCEMLSDFFQRVLAAVLQAEAHLDDLLFAWAERLQNFGGLLAEIEIDNRFRWRDHAAVDDEIAEVRFIFFAYWGFERDRFL